MRRKLYQMIASAIDARETCRANGNREWFKRHTDTIEALTREHMPSGSGFDNPTTLDLDNSTPDCLRFRAAFHHMNDAGYYDGWTYHIVTVRPSLAFEIDLRVTGPNRNDIKGHIAETFHDALTLEFEPHIDAWKLVAEAVA
jgi:hypothetical protein